MKLLILIFEEGNCNNSSSSREAIGERKNKSAPTPLRVGLVFQKSAFLGLWGWREEFVGRENIPRFQYLSGNGKRVPSEAAGCEVKLQIQLHLASSLA